MIWCAQSRVMVCNIHIFLQLKVTPNPDRATNNINFRFPALFHIHKRPRKGQPEAKTYGGQSWLMEQQKFNRDGDMYVESNFEIEGRDILIDPTFGSGINSEADLSGGGEKTLIIAYSWMPRSKYRIEACRAIFTLMVK